jgi:hypothetical protein
MHILTAKYSNSVHLTVTVVMKLYEAGEHYRPRTKLEVSLDDRFS